MNPEKNMLEQLFRKATDETQFAYNAALKAVVRADAAQFELEEIDRKNYPGLFNETM